MRALALLAVLVACGHRGTPARHDAGAIRDAAAIEVPSRPLGMADVSAFAWRKRAGHAAFRAARRAEERGDWPAAVASCRVALAADPDHLDAAWLYAIALAKTGHLAEVAEPLAVAVAGDPGKWAQPSLEHPALQGFLATPLGQAWRRRVEQDRPVFLAALSRALVLGAAGDLYAFDGDTGRWFRLTRTLGGVVGTLAGPHRLAYVARERVKHDTRFTIGEVDLSTGKTTHPVELPACPAGKPLVVAASAAEPAGFWVSPCAGTWSQLDDQGALHPLAAKTARPRGPWLEVSAKAARLHRLPVANVSADWDDHALASAIRIGTSNRVVSAPTGSIDGEALVWSQDRVHLAFVAQLDARCKPGAPVAAAYVVDAATGTVSELERATGGLALEWVSERKLAIAGDRGVAIVELGGGAPTLLAGATDLTSPRRKPKCAPDAEPALPDEDDVIDRGAGTTTDATLPQ